MSRLEVVQLAVGSFLLVAVGAGLLWGAFGMGVVCFGGGMFGLCAAMLSMPEDVPREVPRSWEQDPLP